jgi:hypothetical protein
MLTSMCVAAYLAGAYDMSAGAAMLQCIFVKAFM